MRRRLALGMLLAGLLGVAPLASSTAGEPASRKRLLYITTTAGFHHSACEHSIPIFQKIATAAGLEVVASAKTDLITAESLKGFDAVVFSNTTGGKRQFPVSEENLQALLAFVRSGKAFIGIHAATDTLGDYEPYYDMIGGTFSGHPWTKRVRIDIEDPAHPCASPVPSPWYVDDEIYTFKHWSREKIHVIMSLNVDEESNKGNRDDRDYSIAWCKPYGKGRVFYTSLGHKHSVWDDPIYQKHLMGGVLWALGVESETESGRTHTLRVGHAAPKGDWRPLLDGKELRWGVEWETTGKPAAKFHADWKVLPDGTLQGGGSGLGASHLYYIGKQFRDFEYRADVCINREGNSGMYFRCLPSNLRGGEWKNWPAGYEAQVNNGWDPDPKKSGTFYPKPTLWAKDIERIMGYTKAEDDDDFWFNQHIIAVGNHFIIKLNGQVVVDHYDDKFPAGYFAYQMHHPGTVVKLRNIQVRELD